MIRACLLLAFVITSYSDTVAQTPSSVVIPVYVAPQPIVRYTIGSPPPVIFRPQVQWQPYQFQGSTFIPRTYPTPLRNLLFGTGTITHFYSPQGQQ
jgi:hypothetical protein